MNIKNKKLSILLIIVFAIIAFIRIFNISKSPASLYWEEAALGYDAYSILKTGKDFHGTTFPLVAFESFGDYKPSAYFYAAALSEKLLGLTSFAVRLPSVLSGFTIIIFSYLICLEIFKNQKTKKTIAIISAILVGFSPWAFQFSRAAFEANLATALTSIATWFLLKTNTNKKMIFGSATFFALSLYTYHSTRIFVPTLLLGFLFFNFKPILKDLKIWALAGLISLAIISPILINFNQPEVKHRFQETIAFTDTKPIIVINQLRQDHQNSLLSRVIYHRYWHYAVTVAKSFTSNFNFNYLFISGDQNKRHSTGESGVFYPLDIILLISGVIALKKLKSKKSKLLLFWPLAALIPASLTKTNPHALRTLVAIPAPQIIAAFGATTLFSNLKNHKKLITLIFISLYSIFIFRHFYNYFNVYTKSSASQWQYGYQELMEFIKEKQDNYNQVYITNQLGRPSIYYFFHNQVDPKEVQNEEKTALKDQGERLNFKNINFKLPSVYLPNSLIVTTTALKPNQDILYIVKDPTNQPIFYIYEN